MKYKWYKGNIHSHTTKSDGDDTPDSVVKWYRKHDYDFLVLSDHNHLTLLDYSKGKRHFKRPLMIPGEEVSANIEIDNQLIPLHINAIGIHRLIEPIYSDSIISTIQANIDNIIEAGGIASINHPNYKWAFTHKELTHIKGASLLEIYNGHPKSNNDGGPGKFSTEQIWDFVLSCNKKIFGVATDDSHNYHDFIPSKSNPGRGWLMVKSDKLDIDKIVESLKLGDFYSSTGVILEEINISNKSIDIKISQEEQFIYKTEFIGTNGELLATVPGINPFFKIDKNQIYTRATITSSGGFKAWIQPVFMDYFF